MPRKQINRYVLTIYHDIWAKASLDCYLNDQYQGIIFFVDETITASSSVQSNGILWIYFSIDRLSDIMDMLRHEDPVFIEVRSSYATITTNQEPTGELEPPPST